MTLVPPLSFSKELPVLRVTVPGRARPVEFGTSLFDVVDDPQQLNPLQDADIEQRMIDHLVRLMEACDAPPEQYERLGLGKAGS